MKNLLNNLQRQVDDVKGQRIVAPFYPGSNIQVRVNGAILELEPMDHAKGRKGLAFYHVPFIGAWTIESEKEAVWERVASDHERITYLNLLPQFRCIPVALDLNRPKVFAVQSRPGKITTEGVFPVYIPLAGNVELLREYTVAFDGQIFWLVDQAFGTVWETKAIAEHIGFLNRKHDPNLFGISGTWPGLKKAYATALAYKLEAEKSKDERLIESALKHAGSKLIEYNRLDKERFEVTFDVAGHSKKVTVDKNMNILTAGICLVDQHGEHYKGHAMYDLQSFVGVMREYHTGGH